MFFNDIKRRMSKHSSEARDNNTNHGNESDQTQNASGRIRLHRDDENPQIGSSNHNNQSETIDAEVPPEQQEMEAAVAAEEHISVSKSKEYDQEIVHDILLGIKHITLYTHREQIALMMQLLPTHNDNNSANKSTDADMDTDTIATPREFAEVTDAECRAVNKLIFPSCGSDNTPAHTYHNFDFEEFAPSVFKQLRIRFKIERSTKVQPFEYLYKLFGAPLSLSKNTNMKYNNHDINMKDIQRILSGKKTYLRELNLIHAKTKHWRPLITNSKSGQLFFRTDDNLFIIKSVSKTECNFIRQQLHKLYSYMVLNLDTLISPFLGLYKLNIQMKKAIYFVIQKSVLYVPNPYVFLTSPSMSKTSKLPFIMHKVYDLKGSTLGRQASRWKVELTSQEFQDAFGVATTAEADADAEDVVQNDGDDDGNNDGLLTTVDVEVVNENEDGLLLLSNSDHSGMGAADADADADAGFNDSKRSIAGECLPLQKPKSVNNANSILKEDDEETDHNIDDAFSPSFYVPDLTENLNRIRHYRSDSLQKQSGSNSNHNLMANLASTFRKVSASLSSERHRNNNNETPTAVGSPATTTTTNSNNDEDVGVDDGDDNDDNDGCKHIDSTDVAEEDSHHQRQENQLSSAAASSSSSSMSSSSLSSSVSSPSPSSGIVYKRSRILKDLDFQRDDQTLKIGKQRKNLWIKQLTSDLDFLSKLNVMDYSLLIGIHYKKVPTPHPSKKVKQVRNRNHNDRFDGMQWKCGQLFSFDNGGMSYVEEDEQRDDNAEETMDVNMDADDIKQRNAIFYCGIIDILQQYNNKKKFETFVKSFKSDTNAISSVEPTIYANRMLTFMEPNVQ